MYRIAFTGHRPDKLGGYDWSSPVNRKIGLAMKKAILKEIRSVQETDFEFYFGGALGADQMAFEIVDFIAQQHPELNITKVLCVPFKDQPIKWVTSSKEKYLEQLEKAEKVVYVDKEEGYHMNFPDGTYHPAKMLKRNEYMVDHCQTLIAIYNGDVGGGTFRCVEYAKKKGVNIVYVDPNKA